MDGTVKTKFYAIYTRQSVESCLDINSCHAQFDTCMDYAQRRLQGIEWIGIRFDDEGFSGATCRRPALEHLRKLISERQISHLLITYLDRLNRNLKDTLLLMEEFKSAGAKLHVVKLPELNTSADGQFLCNILASFAEFERDMIRERIAESRAYLKKHGRRLAGRIPFGYDADSVTKQLVINKKEAIQVETIFAIAFDGKTPAQIAEIINERGWRTKKYLACTSGNFSGGSPWSPRQIIALLRNPVYIEMFRDGNNMRPGSHNPIIDPAIFAVVQEKIDERRTNKRSASTAILSFH